MTNENTYPGTPAHQAMLRAITAYYRDDPRIRSLAVFGSLGRGNWDEYSDLDLNAVIADGVKLDVLAEVRALCAALAAIGERAALIVPGHGADEADVVFVSLAHLSIRYHPLALTSPNIVESLLPLSGPLDAAVVRAAGLARREAEEPLEHPLDVCVRAALYVDISLQRGRLWSALAELQRMRDLVMEIYSTAHGGARAIRFFQAEASATLQRALGATLPHYDAGSMQAALAAMLDLLEREIGAISARHLSLSEGQRVVLAGVRARQAARGPAHPPAP